MLPGNIFNLQQGDIPPGFLVKVQPVCNICYEILTSPLRHLAFTIRTPPLSEMIGSVYDKSDVFDIVVVMHCIGPKVAAEDRDKQEYFICGRKFHLWLHAWRPFNRKTRLFFKTVTSSAVNLVHLPRVSPVLLAAPSDQSSKSISAGQSPISAHVHFPPESPLTVVVGDSFVAPAVVAPSDIEGTAINAVECPVVPKSPPLQEAVKEEMHSNTVQEKIQGDFEDYHAKNRSESAMDFCFVPPPSQRRGSKIIGREEERDERYADESKSIFVVPSAAPSHTIPVLKSYKGRSKKDLVLEFDEKTNQVSMHRTWSIGAAGIFGCEVRQGNTVPAGNPQLKYLRLETISEVLFLNIIDPRSMIKRRRSEMSALCGDTPQLSPRSAFALGSDEVRDARFEAIQDLSDTSEVSFRGTSTMTVDQLQAAVKRIADVGRNRGKVRLSSLHLH